MLSPVMALVVEFLVECLSALQPTNNSSADAIMETRSFIV